MNKFDPGDEYPARQNYSQSENDSSVRAIPSFQYETVQPENLPDGLTMTKRSRERVERERAEREKIDSTEVLIPEQHYTANRNGVNRNISWKKKFVGFVSLLILLIVVVVVVVAIQKNTSNDVLPPVNKAGETELFFSYIGKLTKICPVDSNMAVASNSCVEELCSPAESINGNWIIGNGQRNIDVKNEKITFMKNFHGNIHFEFDVYRSIEQKHGFLAYLNGRTLVTCAFYRRKDADINNTGHCESAGQRQDYLLMDKVMIKSILTDYKSDLKLNKGDQITVEFINHGVLCRRPKIVIEGEFYD